VNNAGENPNVWTSIKVITPKNTVPTAKEISEAMNGDPTELRSGFLREFKSMSALFQRCQPAPEVGIGRASADEQESTKWHVLIMIHAK
jgi:hypothetical protein